MKKPVILWIVAALFLFCSFPFFGEGNIGAGVTGIVIAAALGVFGYVTMRKAKSAAEEGRKRAEEEARKQAEEADRQKEENARIQAQKSAEEEARRKEEAEAAQRRAEARARLEKWAETHEIIKCPVSGVTFDSRQRVLATLYKDSEGVGIDGSLEECEHEGAPAVRVLAEGELIGFIRKSDLRKVLPVLSRVEDVTITIDDFDDGGSRIYSAEASISYRI